MTQCWSCRSVVPRTCSSLNPRVRRVQGASWEVRSGVLACLFRLPWLSPLLRCIPSSGIMAVHTYTCNTCNVCLVDIDTLTNVFYYIHGLLSVGDCIHTQTTNVHAETSHEG